MEKEKEEEKNIINMVNLYSLGSLLMVREKYKKIINLFKKNKPSWIDLMIRLFSSFEGNKEKQIIYNIDFGETRKKCCYS